MTYTPEAGTPGMPYTRAATMRLFSTFIVGSGFIVVAGFVVDSGFVVVAGFVVGSGFVVVAGFVVGSGFVVGAGDFYCHPEQSARGARRRGIA